MKKVLSFVAIAFLVMTFMPMMASAKDKTGAFGIGYDNSLAGVDGVSARFQIAKNFGIQAIVGFEQGSLDVGDNNTSNRTMELAIRGDVGIAFTKKTNLSVVFGIDVFNGSTDFDPDDADMSTSNTRLAFEVGLRAEYFFTNFFSINTEVGLAFATASRAADAQGFFANSADDEDDTSGYYLAFGQGDVFGAAGFTFWFN